MLLYEYVVKQLLHCVPVPHGMPFQKGWVAWECEGGSAFDGAHAAAAAAAALARLSCHSPYTYAACWDLVLLHVIGFVILHLALSCKHCATKKAIV